MSSPDTRATTTNRRISSGPESHLMFSRETAKYRFAKRSKIAVQFALLSYNRQFTAGGTANSTHKSKAPQQKVSCARQHILAHRGLGQHSSDFNCPHHR